MVQSAEPPGGPDASRSERSAHQAREAHAADERILRAEGVEERLHLSADDLAAYLAVESIKGFGPQKFRELYETGLTPAEIVASPTLLQLKGSRTEGFRRELESIVRDGMQTYRARAVRQLVRACNAAQVSTFSPTLAPSIHGTCGGQTIPCRFST